MNIQVTIATVNDTAARKSKSICVTEGFYTGTSPDISEEDAALLIDRTTDRIKEFVASVNAK